MYDGYLAKAIGNGQFIVTVECSPPRGTEAKKLQACAAALGGLVHAVYAPESEDGVRMSSLAACSHLAAAGAEPILSLLSRDMNRIALQAAILGASSMEVHNILCLSGKHQTLTTSSSARGVFDIDPIQLLQVADGMRKEGQLADGRQIEGKVNLILGADANPFAEPMELYLIVLEKAVAAGADYVITQPIFDIERFTTWLNIVRGRGLDRKICIIASVMPLTSAQEATELSGKYQRLCIPDVIIDSLKTARDQRAAGMQTAVETIARLRAMDGVRGIHLMTGDDFQTAADILKSSGLSRS